MPSKIGVAVTSLLLVALGAVIAMSSTDTAEAVPAVVVVNATNDPVPPFSIPDGLCSLREAIVATNSNNIVDGCNALGSTGTDRINFAIDPPLINLVPLALPAITAPVIINGGAGKVEVRGPGGPLVGGAHGFTVTGNNVEISNLLITNHRDDGIFVTGTGFELFGSYVGIGADGSTAMPNAGFGVQIQGEGALIGGATDGGDCSGTCNVIAGNLKDNLLLDLNGRLATVRGNFIGTNAFGTGFPQGATAVPGITTKSYSPIIGGANGTTPGGPCTGDCNLIVGGTGWPGLFVDIQTISAQVYANFIGTDVTGMTGIATNQSYGIINKAEGTQIGGGGPTRRNVIAGNGSANVFLEAGWAHVRSNYIGLNSAGTGAVPGNGTGILVTNADGSTEIGSFQFAESGNVISGAQINGGTGIVVHASEFVGIWGNRIGTAADGVSPVPNDGDGVWLGNAVNNARIGGDGAGAPNTIAFNGSVGVRVGGSSQPSTGNTIRRNSIHTNAGKGIENHPNGNGELAPPVITAASVLGASGTACPNCLVDVYSDSDDEGRIWDALVMADGAGNWAYTDLVSGPNVTATATDAGGNTSEFSASFDVTPATPTPSPSPSPSPTPTPTASPTSTPTATPTGVPTVTPTPSPTGAGQQVPWGDHNCSDLVDSVDALITLRFDAGLSAETNECPEMGAEVDVANASSHIWGDLDCSGAVNSIDALKVLRHDAGLSVDRPPSCPDPGQSVTVTPVSGG